MKPLFGVDKSTPFIVLIIFLQWIKSFNETEIETCNQPPH